LAPLKFLQVGPIKKIYKSAPKGCEKLI